MPNKKCCICKNEVDLTRFKSNKAKKDGLQSQCIDCQQKYRREHYLKNRQKYIQKAKTINEKTKSWWKDYKKNLQCERCKENHPACLHFHHLDSTQKDGNVSTMVLNKARYKVLKEISKCIILCANCHAKEHWQD